MDGFSVNSESVGRGMDFKSPVGTPRSASETIKMMYLP